jgi:hypothetical protein
MLIIVGRPYQPSLMFVGKPGNQYKSGALERRFTRIGAGLIHKYMTRLEMLARNKHSKICK